jgi:hypothetical protein
MPPGDRPISTVGTRSAKSSSYKSVARRNANSKVSIAPRANVIDEIRAVAHSDPGEAPEISRGLSPQ